MKRPGNVIINSPFVVPQRDGTLTLVGQPTCAA